jgi:glycosyltransferase involved in cell wall biosynthesis
VRIAEIAPPWISIPPRGYGGIELIVDLLARSLAERGHDVTLFAPEGSVSAATVVSPLEPAGVHRIGNAFFETHHVLTAYLRRGDFDLIHDHTLVGSALATLVGDEQPIVHTLHGPWTEAMREYYALVHERVHLVAISETQRSANDAVRYAATIPNGIDVAAHPLGEGPREDFLVFIGRANDEKAPERAVELAHRAGRPLKLIVKRSEPAEIEYWRRMVEPLLGPDDEVLPELGHDEKVDLLGRGRAFVFPICWEEPFGLVLAEAMACGMPVVAAPRGAVRDLVVHGKTGFLSEDLDELAAAIDRIDEISPHACRRRVEDHFSLEAMAAGYERLFRRLADDARAA